MAVWASDLDWKTPSWGSSSLLIEAKRLSAKSVVVAITHGTHALLPAQTLEQSTGGAGVVLAAEIGVEDGLRCDQSGVEGAAQGGVIRPLFIVSARFSDGLRGLDLRGRSTPHGIQPRADNRHGP
jgi:hypothetical protein